VLLNLLIAELEDLEAFWEGGLGRLGVCEVVDYLLVGVSLFDVVVVEVDDSVSVREGLATHAIREDHLLFAVEIGPLDLPVVSNNLILNCDVGMLSRRVILLRQLHLKVILGVLLKLFHLADLAFLLLVTLFLRTLWLFLLDIVVARSHHLVDIVFVGLKLFESILSPQRLLVVRGLRVWWLMSTLDQTKSLAYPCPLLLHLGWFFLELSLSHISHLLIIMSDFISQL